MLRAVAVPGAAAGGRGGAAGRGGGVAAGDAAAPTAGGPSPRQWYGNGGRWGRRRDGPHLRARAAHRARHGPGGWAKSQVGTGEDDARLRVGYRYDSAAFARVLGVVVGGTSEGMSRAQGTPLRRETAPASPRCCPGSPRSTTRTCRAERRGCNSFVRHPWHAMRRPAPSAMCINGTLTPTHPPLLTSLCHTLSFP